MNREPIDLSPVDRMNAEHRHTHFGGNAYSDVFDERDESLPHNYVEEKASLRLDLFDDHSEGRELDFENPVEQSFLYIDGNSQEMLGPGPAKSVIRIDEMNGCFERVLDAVRSDEPMIEPGRTEFPVLFGKTLCPSD